MGKEMGDYTLPARVQPTAGRTGGSKCRDANSLPRVFLGVATGSGGRRCALHWTEVRLTLDQLGVAG